MKHSLSYYLTLLVINLKGLKKDFSVDPIDYDKIRKADIHHPKGKFVRNNKVHNFRIANTLITEIKKDRPTGILVLFIHGGAFISGPMQHHWDTCQEIANHTKHTIWMCDYPKAPENKISEISANIDAVYKTALARFDAKQIILIGDSVGGTLITALTQRLVIAKTELPLKIILVSPVMDATMSNSKICKIDIIDPMLSKPGVLSAKKMCVENNDLSNPMISPINGSFVDFPETILYLATNDITYPDQQLAVQKMIDANTMLEVVEGDGMPHIWPLLPVMKEAKVALAGIIGRLNSK